MAGAGRGDCRAAGGHEWARVSPRESVRRGSGHLAVCVAACMAARAVPASADRGSLLRGPGQRPGPAILYAPAARAPQLTNAGSGGPSRSSSPAPARTAAASSSIRTSSTTTTAPEPTPDPGDRARRRLALLAAERHLHVPDRAGLREQRRRPRRAARQAARRRDRVPADASTRSSTRSSPRRRSRSATRPRRGLALTAPTRRRPGRAVPDLAREHGGARGRRHRPAASTRRRRRRSTRRRRQVELTRPAQRLGPGPRTVRLAAGVGLWDQANRRYLAPGGVADADPPGGAGGLSSPTAFFNVAFRPPSRSSDLRHQRPDRPRVVARPPPGQRARGRRLSPLLAQVDFDLLARSGRRQPPRPPEGVPRTGTMNRILSSRFQTGPGGTDFRDACSRRRRRLPRRAARPPAALLALRAGGQALRRRATSSRCCCTRSPPTTTSSRLTQPDASSATARGPRL